MKCANKQTNKLSNKQTKTNKIIPIIDKIKYRKINLRKKKEKEKERVLKKQLKYKKNKSKKKKKN